MKSQSHESAVSEIMGEVLMLGLVTLLATIIAALVLGLAGNLQESSIMGVTATRGANGFVSVTYHGGQDTANLVALNITVNGTDIENATRRVYLNAANVPVDVGNTTLLTAPKPGKDRVVVTGSFADGRQQLLLDTTL